MMQSQISYVTREPFNHQTQNNMDSYKDTSPFCLQVYGTLQYLDKVWSPIHGTPLQKWHVVKSNLYGKILSFYFVFFYSSTTILAKMGDKKVDFQEWTTTNLQVTSMNWSTEWSLLKAMMRI